MLAKEKQKTADFITNFSGLPDATPADGAVSYTKIALGSPVLPGLAHPGLCLL